MNTILQTERILIEAAGGFAAPTSIEPELAAVVAAALSDPIVLKKVSDRVFELLCQDLRRQQERRAGP